MKRRRVPEWGLPVVAMAIVATGVGAQEVPMWRLEEIQRIGSVDGPDALTLITDVAVTDDGRLLVTQPMEGHVKVFGPGGALSGVIGRAGEGPGEFRQASRLGRIGDTIYVVDDVARRLTFFDGEGRVLRTVPSGTPRLGMEFTSKPPMRLAANGEAIAAPTHIAGALAANPLLARPILRTTWAGEILDTLHLLSLQHSASIVLEEGHQYFGRQPFADNPTFDVARDGSYFVVVDRTTEGEVEQLYQARKIGIDGSVEADVVRTGRRLPLGRVLRERTIEAAIRSSGSWLARPRMREAFRASLHVPRYLPAATDAVVGDDGRVWVRRERQEGEVLWDILSPHLVPIAQVRTPESWSPRVSDGATVWASVKDEFDVVYLVRYQIER